VKGLPIVYEQGVNPDNKDKFFVMERLGCTLTQVIKRNRFIFSYEQIIVLGCQLIESLESFHDLGYVHCDIKPDNIIFGFAQTSSNKAKPQIFSVGEVEEKKGEDSEDSEDLPEYKAHLIDYGLAHSYRLKSSLSKEEHKQRVKLPVSLLDLKDWKHIPNTKYEGNPINNFKGNLAFSSRNAFTGNTLSRRDDLISVMYLLANMTTGAYRSDLKNMTLA